MEFTTDLYLASEIMGQDIRGNRSYAGIHEFVVMRLWMLLEPFVISSTLPSQGLLKGKRGILKVLHADRSFLIKQLHSEQYLLRASCQVNHSIPRFILPVAFVALLRRLSLRTNLSCDEL